MTVPLRSRAEILAALAPRNLSQPATALWRVYEIEAIEQHVAFAGRVLDIGCGDGSLGSVAFRNAGASLDRVGLEPDPTDAEDARRSGVYGRVHVAPGDAIPEPDASFDMVFSNSVLEHIPQIEPVLSEVRRVLRPGGRFAFTVPSELFHECLGPAGVLERWLAPEGETAQARIDRRLRHHRYWSPDAWRDALAPAGLHLCEVHRYFPARAVQHWQRVSAWTGGLVFELLGRRSEMRAAQRRLRVQRLQAALPRRARAALLHAIIRNGLAEPADGAPSGGLLVVALRS